MVECSETLRKKRLVDDACIKKLVTHKRARRGGGEEEEPPRPTLWLANLIFQREAVTKSVGN